MAVTVRLAQDGEDVVYNEATWFEYGGGLVRVFAPTKEPREDDIEIAVHAAGTWMFARQDLRSDAP
jgi:hypothetical protein